jgi:hypothetical protein
MRKTVGVICAATAAVYAFIPFMDETTAMLLASEDQLAEWLGALAYLGASVMAVLAYVASRGHDNRFFGYATERNIFMALLAVLFFMAFGEEISWGQRLFGWETPASLAAVNMQSETNLHNLWLFHANTAGGSQKPWIERMLNADRLISVFWFLYCVIVPIAVLASTAVGKLVQRVGFPVPPLLAGAVFLANYFASKLTVTFFRLDTLHERALAEYREAAYGVGFLVLGILLWRYFAEKGSVPARIVETGSRLGHAVRT